MKQYHWSGSPLADYITELLQNISNDIYPEATKGMTKAEKKLFTAGYLEALSAVLEGMKKI